MIKAFSNTSKAAADYNITHIMVISSMNVTMPNMLYLRDYRELQAENPSFGIFSQKKAKCPVSDRDSGIIPYFFPAPFPATEKESPQALSKFIFKYRINRSISSAGLRMQRRV